jgi:hypothetical protein
MNATAVLRRGRPEGVPLSCKRTKEAAAQWIAGRLKGKEADTYVVGFTCKQAIPGVTGQVYMNRELLTEALRVYFRRIDWAVFGNASRRARKAVERVCCIEGGRWPDKRWHAHALVVVPSNHYIERSQFIGLLKSAWQSSPWGMEEFYCKPMKKEIGCNARYLVKTGVDAMDWPNCRLSDT